MRTPRRLTAVAVLVATALAGTPAMLSSADATPSESDRSVARAADRYNAGEDALRDRLRDDPSLRLTSSGFAYFVDPAPTGSREPARVAQQAFPLAETFQLHSKPDSLKTIYLDFDGQDVSNTLWSTNFDGAGPGTAVPNGTHPAMDLAGNGATFTDSEKLQVQDIYQRVAEDYAPFDVDVTTEDPGAAAIDRGNEGDAEYGTRALITPSNSALNSICGGNCGGVAFIGVFDFYQGLDPDPTIGHDDLQPAWIFPQALGNDVKNIGEATTHEVGHNLGLDHDATSTQGYYDGDSTGDLLGDHNGWAPIMGVAYNEPIGQFALNDYPDGELGGLGMGTLQSNPDDVVTITQFGAVLRSDELGGSIATAPAVPSDAAYIRNRVDADYYALGACSETVSVDAEPAEVSPNLDIELQLLNSSNGVVTTANPPSSRVSFDVASGMDASISTPVADGNYYVRIDGVGRGTSTNGYTDYGSIGAYTLAFTGCDGVVPPPPPPPATNAPGKTRIGKATPGKRGGKRTAKVTWQPPSAAANPAINGYQVIAYRRKSNGKYVKASTSQVLPAGARSVKFTAGKRAKYKFAVKARNGLGFGPLSAKSNAVTPR